METISHEPIEGKKRYSTSKTILASKLLPSTRNLVIPSTQHNTNTVRVKWFQKRPNKGIGVWRVFFMLIELDKFQIPIPKWYILTLISLRHLLYFLMDSQNRSFEFLSVVRGTSRIIIRNYVRSLSHKEAWECNKMIWNEHTLTTSPCY